MLEEFFIITMKTNKDRTLYLESNIGNSCKWTFNKEDAIWFNTSFDAERFCTRYFKNFKNYKIEPIEYYI